MAPSSHVFSPRIIICQMSVPWGLCPTPEANRQQRLTSRPTPTAAHRPRGAAGCRRGWNQGGHPRDCVPVPGGGDSRLSPWPAGRGREVTEAAGGERRGEQPWRKGLQPQGARPIPAPCPASQLENWVRAWRAWASRWILPLRKVLLVAVASCSCSSQED